MKYRCFLPDWFADVEAESEEEAERKMVELVREQISIDKVICWEQSPNSIGYKS